MQGMWGGGMVIRQGSELKPRAELGQAAEPGCVAGDLLPGRVGRVHPMGLGRACLGFTPEALPLLCWCMWKRMENSREGDPGKFLSGGGI